MMRQDNLLDSVFVHSLDSYLSILHALVYIFLLFLLFSCVFCGVIYPHCL